MSIARATAAVRSRLRSVRGAIDLASVMVGVIVIGVLSGIIALAVFAVVPWAQDSAARDNLRSLALAQSVSQVQHDRYDTVDALAEAELIPVESSLTASTNTEGSCFIGVARSDSGKLFYGTSKDPGIRDYVKGTSETATAWCAAFPPIPAGGDEPTDTPAPATPGATTVARLGNAQQSYLVQNGEYAKTIAALPADVVGAGESMKLIRSSAPTYTNVVPDGSFGGAIAGRFTGGQAASTITQVATGGNDGGPFVRLKQGTAGNLSAANALTLASVPVEPGKQYTVTAFVRSSVAAPVFLNADIYDAAGVKVGTLNTGATTAVAANAWTTVGGVLSSTVPLTGVTMKISAGTGNWFALNATFDIDGVVGVLGVHSYGSPKQYPFREFFQEKPGGYVALIRAADGTTTAVTSAIATPFAVFDNTWTPAAGGFVVASTSNFPTTLPDWAWAVGVTHNDDTWWTTYNTTDPANIWVVKK